MSGVLESPGKVIDFYFMTTVGTLVVILFYTATQLWTDYGVILKTQQVLVF